MKWTILVCMVLGPLGLCAQEGELKPDYGKLPDDLRLVVLTEQRLSKLASVDGFILDLERLPVSHERSGLSPGDALQNGAGMHVLEAGISIREAFTEAVKFLGGEAAVKSQMRLPPSGMVITCILRRTIRREVFWNLEEDFLDMKTEAGDVIRFERGLP